MSRTNIVFDAYGTLWNVTSIRSACEAVVGSEHAVPFLDLWRQKQLEYAFLRTVMDRYKPFSQVTADALAFATATFGLSLDQQATDLLVHAWFRPQPYPDAPLALHALKGHARAILSNGDPEMLSEGVQATGMAHDLEAVLSVDAARRYKPHPAAYQLSCDYFHAPAAEIVFVSSNSWDISGATHFGFWTIWVNRTGAPADILGVKPAAVVSSLTEIPAALLHLT